MYSMLHLSSRSFTFSLPVSLFVLLLCHLHNQILLKFGTHMSLQWIQGSASILYLGMFSWYKFTHIAYTMIHNSHLWTHILRFYHLSSYYHKVQICIHICNFSLIIFRFGIAIHCPKISEEFEYEGSASLNMHIMEFTKHITLHES